MIEEIMDDNGEPGYILENWINIFSDNFQSLSERIALWSTVDMEEEQQAILLVLLINHLSSDLEFFRTMQKMKNIFKTC